MKLSIALPVYNMPRGDFFLKRALKSLEDQTFQDFEVVVTNDGKMAENTNSAIKQSKGEFIKILYQDDYLTHKDSLREIVYALTDTTQWLVTGCTHDPGGRPHLPAWNENIKEVNTIGSPSVLTIRNDHPLLFDEELSWLLDCDYYKRMHAKFGFPVFLNDINVTLGVGDHQMTHILTDQEKLNEHNYVRNKYN